MMKPIYGRFVKKSILTVLAAGFMFGQNGRYVYAFSGDDVFAGATGLVKEAFEKIQNGPQDEDLGESFNMEIEPMVERDLSGTIMNGIYFDDINMSGKTYDEAVKLIRDKVKSMSTANITLNSIGGNSVSATAQDLGLTWDDTNLVADALYVGRSGNIAERYKERKDLEHDKKVYPINVEFDRETVEAIVNEQGELYNVEATDATLSKADGDFVVTPGTKGEKIDANASVSRIMSALDNFTGSDLTIDMAGAILSVPAIEFGMVGDKMLMIQTNFTDDEEINGYFLLVPDLPSYSTLLKALGVMQ
jgi:chemotaxis protein CheY-P-specific phosphatase CheC